MIDLKERKATTNMGAVKAPASPVRRLYPYMYYVITRISLSAIGINYDIACIKFMRKFYVDRYVKALSNCLLSFYQWGVGSDFGGFYVLKN